MSSPPSSREILTSSWRAAPHVGSRRACIPHPRRGVHDCGPPLRATRPPRWPISRDTAPSDPMARHSEWLQPNLRKPSQSPGIGTRTAETAWASDAGLASQPKPASQRNVSSRDKSDASSVLRQLGTPTFHDLGEGFVSPTNGASIRFNSFQGLYSEKLAASCHGSTVP